MTIDPVQLVLFCAFAVIAISVLIYFILSVHCERAVREEQQFWIEKIRSTWNDGYAKGEADAWRQAEHRFKRLGRL